MRWAKIREPICWVNCPLASRPTPEASPLCLCQPSPNWLTPPPWTHPLHPSPFSTTAGHGVADHAHPAGVAPPPQSTFCALERSGWSQPHLLLGDVLLCVWVSVSDVDHPLPPVGPSEAGCLPPQQPHVAFPHYVLLSLHWPQCGLADMRTGLLLNTIPHLVSGIGVIIHISGMLVCCTRGAFWAR